MKPPKGKIVVSVNPSQKDEAVIGGNILKTGKAYNENFRERNPVVAKVEVGNKEIPTGSFIVCNYNYFDLESPLNVMDNLYSIPVNEEIFAIVNQDGSLTPVCGNLLVSRVDKEYTLDMPPELKKPKINMGMVASNADYWKRGMVIFWLPYSDYEICYNWNGQDKRAIKIHESEITGYLKNALI